VEVLHVPDSAAPVPPGSGYVALGSSFAAGPGIPPVIYIGALTKISMVNAVLRRIPGLSASGAELVRASAASSAHGAGSAQPWVSGFRFGNPLTGGPVPYHPTRTGMPAVARLVVGQVTGAAGASAAR